MSLFHHTVEARTCALRYRHGRLEAVLDAGRHPKVRGSRLVTVDLRERLLTLSPQEILTADGVSTRVTAAVRWNVADPTEFAERAEDPVARVYLATQVALREALVGLDVEQLVARGAVLDLATVTAATAAVARSVGIQVDEVLVKDVILPPELRRAAAELATARQRGAAQLEQARSETAALRSMANGARLLAANPALATLRMIQSAPPGTQLVLRFDGSAAAGSATAASAGAAATDPADGAKAAGGPGV
ncbi:MAG: slipin family protein [Terracoccus sp.]